MRPFTSRASGPLAVLSALTLFTLAQPQAASADGAASVGSFSSVQVSTASAPPGGTVTITLSITNTEDTTQLVEVGARLSAPLFSQPGTCDHGSSPAPDDCSVSAGFVLLNYGGNGLAPHTTATATITTTVPLGTAPGAYTLTPFGRGEEVGDDTLSPSTIPFTVAAAADVAVGLTAAPGPLLSDTVDYTQTATNNGPGTTTSGTVTTQLPATATGASNLPSNCTYTSASNSVACTYTNLANGSRQTNAFTANLGALSLGSLTATSTLTANTPTDPNTANNTATTTCQALTGLIITC